MRSNNGNVVLELGALVGMLGFCDVCPDLSRSMSRPIRNAVLET